MQLFTFIASLSLLFNAPAFATSIKGIPRILDGDTVEIGSTRVRLLGIDAPETDQACLNHNREAWTCGISSRDELSKQFGKKEWVCLPNGKDRYKRTLAKCTANGQDIQQWMVRNGWAISFVRYSHAYDSDEVEARNQRAGLWAGAFIAPWDWRSRTKITVILGATAIPTSSQSMLLPGGPSDVHPTGCEIKGNARRRGICIYHRPGGRWYSKVNMRSKGKRWFCSVADAEAAGCRPAKE